ALIDLEHMKSAVNGFIGDINSSRGLINCVSAEQIDIVIEEACKQGVAITDEQAQEAKARRLKDLESDKQLLAFYTRNGIATGKEQIQVNLDSLGLDLTETAKIRVPVLAYDDDEEKEFIKWE